MSTPALKIYNTLTRKKEEFRPLDPANVRMYVCGPTVYDYAHIGNARPLIVFDVLFRLLRHLYGAEHVTYVRNITDVDDKINARAAERGISIRELTEETNRVFQEDVRALGCLEPTIQPRATEHIAQMIAIIEKLIASGHAYAADGHVLFDVPSMPNYGRLSRRSLDEMIAGARVDVAPYKRGDMDFVLWKPSKENEPGWDSPWGRGRPGWHIECSAMSWAHLGETFDIHGGGIDLVFPHHENEIAQSCCAFGQDVMANYWMHNGFLQVEGEKMSKSLGNFVTIHELLHTEKFGGRSWHGPVLRFAMLRTHYRQPIDWTVKALEEAHAELQEWTNLLASCAAEAEFREHAGLLQPNEQVLSALGDDLNTPLAISELRALARSRVHGDKMSLLDTCIFLGIINSERMFVLNPHHVGERVLASREVMRQLDELQVAFANDNEERQRAIINKLKEEGVEANVSSTGTVSYKISGRDKVGELIHMRNAARASKNWAESDRIRDELAAMGIALKDNKDGTTTWEVKR
jgi:cysteinyl-tRNA synthetase